MRESAKVFISYSHDSAKHMECVLALSDRLRQDGIDCHIDQYEMSPSEGWPRWTVNKVEWADFVLVLCTSVYRERFRGKAPSGQGKGVKWEGAILTQELYEAESKNTRFIPVVLSSRNTEHIPVILRGQTYYDLSTEKGYEALYRRLTDQPEIEKPERGKLKPMPPRKPGSGRERKNSFGPSAHQECNRNPHVCQFQEFFFDKCGDPSYRCYPQFYIIHGSEGQCHDSLVARFQYTYFGNKTLEIKVPWPGSMKLEDCKVSLHYRLCEKITSEFKGAQELLHNESLMTERHKLCKEISSVTLFKLLEPNFSDLKAYDTVLIVHRIMASKWKHARKSLHWYLKEYWSLPFKEDRGPQFLIFLNVVYPDRKSFWDAIRNWFIKKWIQNSLNNVYETVKEECLCLLLEELRHVSQEDVDQWIWENAQRLSELERNEKTKDIFKGKSYLPMSQVEDALKKIVLENNQISEEHEYEIF